MSFDKPTRNLLARVVGDCRDRLVQDVTEQLQSVYGLHPDGTVLDVARTEDDRRAAEDLQALWAHFEAAEAGGAKARRAAAYQRMVREIGFTTLNRLAALRLGEERGLVIECVRRGASSEGFQLYERIAGGALGNRYRTYRAFLEGLFDELALDLGVLFDRSIPQSRVFPGEAALTDVLELLNDPELADRNVWQQDETIGWIYQYYNDPAERKAMRDASQAPRNSRELAVRNQFFTPRYVVEFLTDNTLGRIWYEMRQGDTRLAEQCRYLVRRPNEVFLRPGEKAPPDGKDTAELTQEELLRRPLYIPHRPKKDPRDLKILDPACGSGHFLLYAFDLLTTIYEEAWADADLPPFGETGTWLVRDYSDLEDLRAATPGLILRHNLHGIDIDPRAVQIAALALWLRAQRAYQQMSLSSAGRPRITKTNIVTAEPMPGDRQLLEEFVHDLRPRVLGDLVRLVFEKMQLAGEAGSLLKIEEDLQEAVAEAHRQWARGSQPEQLALFPEFERPTGQQPVLFDVSGITDAAFWETAEERVLEELHRYASQAENGRGTRRRLFAEDAIQGLSFVDLCKQLYDVVLMNPPFGEPSQLTRTLVKGAYGTRAANLLSAFVLRAQKLTPAGILGTITDSTWLKKTDYGDLRTLLIDENRLPIALADLGWNVLDGANVATCAFVSSGNVSDPNMIVFRLVDFDAESRMQHLAHSIELMRTTDAYTGKDCPVFVRSWAFFQRFPESALAYETPSLLVTAFEKWQPLEPSWAQTRRGYTPGDTFRFFRCWWEVSTLERGRTWWTLNNGSPYTPILGQGFYASLNAEDDDWRIYKGKAGFRLESKEWFGKPGLGYGKRTDFMYAYPLPARSMFSNEGHCVFPNDNLYWTVLGYLNSIVCQALINLYCGQHKTAGYVSKVPTPDLYLPAMQEIGQYAKEVWFRGEALGSRDETLENFLTLLHRDRGEDLTTLGREFRRAEQWYRGKLDAIDSTVLMLAAFRKEKREGAQPTLVVNRPSPSLVSAIPVASNMVQGMIHPSNLLQFCTGIAIGRWDIRYSLASSLSSNDPDPTASLPVCPPGMLISPDGLPATPNRIVSEAWLRARPDANTLSPEGSFEGPATISDDEYPIPIAWDGILVDDSGVGGNNPHPSDIVRRVREVLAVLWPDNHDAIEAEACEILGVRELRDYFRQPTKFFADHLSRYSKSRRKAPIYWPLSTASGSYTLWLYYHRLDDQILYTAVNRYVTPKIERVERHVAELETTLLQASGRSASEVRDQLDSAREFLSELRAFREELLRIAELPYEPNLNDGVIINAAPLHKLFGLRKWAQDTEKVWKELEAGEYDWAHMAYTLWPERVREVCKHDRSIAIAHGLEALWEGGD